MLGLVRKKKILRLAVCFLHDDASAASGETEEKRLDDLYYRCGKTTALIYLCGKIGIDLSKELFNERDAR